MPYQNEHAARQVDPRKFVDFRRKLLGRGVSAIFGITQARRDGDRSDPLQVQALRFDARKWTVAKAQAWLRDHGFKSRVEPAKRTRDLASDRARIRALRAKLRAKIRAAQKRARK